MRTNPGLDDCSFAIANFYNDRHLNVLVVVHSSFEGEGRLVAHSVCPKLCCVEYPGVIVLNAWLASLVSAILGCSKTLPVV